MSGQISTAKSLWEPVTGSATRSKFGRFLSFWCYPAVFPFSILIFDEANAFNAKKWRILFGSLLTVGGSALHALAYQRTVAQPGRSWLSWQHVLAHLGVFLTWDHSFLWMTSTAHWLIDIFNVDRAKNRLNAGNLHGDRIVVIGNGPSALEGEQYGAEIDKFDEVVRFNNFVCKAAGMEKWVGTKTTVHFSDGVLYPTFKEYHVPGATVVLSLFMDRFMIAGSYCILRGGADLQTSLMLKFFMDRNTTWIEKERIEKLKEKLGCKGPKHPTSGMLAIDYFLSHPKAKLPIVIHGFDFFQGPKMHYYDKVEPLYERINNYVGVNMHSPHLEKIYVQKLIDEGKVIFLKDWVKTRK